MTTGQTATSGDVSERPGKPTYYRKLEDEMYLKKKKVTIVKYSDFHVKCVSYDMP